MSHLISDFEVGMGEDDLTHFPETLSLHDLGCDPEAGDYVAFKARSERDFENRCFHQRVFDTNLAVRLVDHMRLKILVVETIVPLHILVIAQKVKNGGSRLIIQSSLVNLHHFVRLAHFHLIYLGSRSDL